MAHFSSSPAIEVEGKPVGKMSSELTGEGMRGSKSIHMPHDAIVRAPGLLPMLYKPSELCEELGVPRRLLRLWLKLGLPHQRDGRCHIWVNGEELKGWLLAVHAARKPSRLRAGEGFCFRCAKPVRMAQVEVIRLGRVALLRGKCPVCGAGVNCGARNGQ
jgi:hypothetical protein